MSEFHHAPVLLEECIAGLDIHPDGTYEDTGLLYAVNTNDGSVHRLGYDSSGNYTLITISNR